MNNLIKTKHNWYPNTSISFDANGVWIRVSLNVEPKIGKHLSPNNVTKGKSRTVYALKMHIMSDMVNKNTLESAQKTLLENCMNNIRKAKKSWEEKNILPQNQIG